MNGGVVIAASKDAQLRRWHMSNIAIPFFKKFILQKLKGTCFARHVCARARRRKSARAAELTLEPAPTRTFIMQRVPRPLPRPAMPPNGHGATYSAFKLLWYVASIGVLCASPRACQGHCSRLAGGGTPVFARGGGGGRLRHPKFRARHKTCAVSARTHPLAGVQWV